MEKDTETDLKFIDEPHTGDVIKIGTGRVDTSTSLENPYSKKSEYAIYQYQKNAVFHTKRFSLVKENSSEAPKILFEFLQLLKREEDHSILAAEKALTQAKKINEKWIESAYKYEGVSRAVEIVEETREQFYLVRGWQLADQEDLRDIALEIIDEVIKTERFKWSKINGNKFQFSKGEEEILKQAGLLTFFSSYEQQIENILEEQREILFSEKKEEPTRKVYDFKKADADHFAVEMGSYLENARQAGFHSLRQIAKYFNEKNIKSALGGVWSLASAQSLIKRRQKLWLEEKGINE